MLLVTTLVKHVAVSLDRFLMGKGRGSYTFSPKSGLKHKNQDTNLLSFLQFESDLFVCLMSDIG